MSYIEFIILLTVMPTARHTWSSTSRDQQDDYKTERYYATESKHIPRADVVI